MQNLYLLILLLFHVSLLQHVVFSWGQSLKTLKSNRKASSSSTPVYHMGPVSTLPTNIYIIWYGAQWNNTHKSVIKDFIASLSAPTSSIKEHPQVSEWWATLADYTDQTDANITRTIKLAGEFEDSKYSQGKTMSRLSIQHVIKNAVDRSNPRRLPLDYTNGIYLVLTSREVTVAEFCRAVCGFHYFTFLSVVGAILPYAWIGYSGTQCPGYCAYPFARTELGPKLPLMHPPNGDVGIDGMISVIAHELAEVSSNPLINAWYAGDNPTAPLEIADMCLGIYGKGAGGGYPGTVYFDSKRNAYNLYGVNGRKFLVQWLWNLQKNTCYGPNANIRGH